MRRYLLPFVIIIIAGIGYWYIDNNAPKPRKRPPPKPASLSVKVTTINSAPLQITLSSLGQVSAKTSSNISSQLSGRITHLSASLSEGAFFKKGELLITLDNREYQNNINSAKANLTQAQQDLTLEQAQVDQAKADWQRLNKNIAIPALVSRTPQVMSAKAKVSAAHASFNQAVLNFNHTKIFAPFDGTVLSKSANVGDFVNANTSLAEVFSTDALQVRLSLKNSDLAFIQLPQLNTYNTQSKPLAAVVFEANLIERQHWQGELVRTEGRIDEQSQQLFVIGQITEPFSAANQDKHPLKIGQYLSAKITGKKIQDAINISIKTIYQGQYVYLVKKGLVFKQPVAILWQDDTTALIGKGLRTGDQLITSILSQDDEGSSVMIKGKPNQVTSSAKSKNGSVNTDHQGDRASPKKERAKKRPTAE